MLGPPGSAKSTIAGELLGRLPGSVDLEKAALLAIRHSGEDGVAKFVARLTRAPGNPLWKWVYARSSDRFSALTRFIDEHPKVMQRVTKTQRKRSKRDRSQDVVLGWLLNLMARYQLAVENAELFERLVIDEGFCQRAVALFGYGFDDQDMSRLTEYVEAMPTPDVVILVETPVEICERRLDSRGWSERVTELDPSGRHQFLLDSVRVVEEVVALLGAKSRLIRVDGTKPPTEVTERLITALSG
ncbi:MAG: hypothetical protein PVG83_03535 [Acidimicrobiia bacterium]|jgi:adenylate kinase family enzyme